MSSALWPTRVGLADQVVELLLASITGGEFLPDSQLPPEGDLAERCQVSRLTLREAIKSLRAKGVVRVEQGRGTFVNPRSMWSPLDPALLSARFMDATGTSDLSRSLTEARRIVEVGVAELAASRHTDSDLDALQSAFERMQRADEDNDPQAFTVADIDFHDAVFQAAGNEVIGALFQPIEALVRMVRYETSTVVETRTAGLVLHQAIADAVASGSSEEARQAMLEHFRHTELTLLRALERVTQPELRPARARTRSR